MASKKWNKVKVKVNGKMVDRWTDGKSFRVAEPIGQRLTKAVQSTHKVGTYNVGRTKKWDGTKWVKVNVTHAGQKATRNGKPVVADGKGNWVTPRPNSLSGHGAKQGTYQKGDKAAPKPQGRNWSNPHGQVSNKPSSGDPSTWSKAKEPTTTPSASSSHSSSSTSSSRSNSTGTSRRASTPQSKDMDANYKAWAKANPGLAKKVKKGQSGYKALNSSTSRAAGPADAQNLRSGPTPPKRTPPNTSPKPKPAKPAATTTPPKKKRTWLADNYKPSSTNNNRRSSPGQTNNKPKQSARLNAALNNLKVRKY